MQSLLVAQALAAVAARAPFEEVAALAVAFPALEGTIAQREDISLNPLLFGRYLPLLNRIASDPTATSATARWRQLFEGKLASESVCSTLRRGEWAVADWLLALPERGTGLDRQELLQRILEDNSLWCARLVVFLRRQLGEEVSSYAQAAGRKGFEDPACEAFTCYLANAGFDAVFAEWFLTTFDFGGGTEPLRRRPWRNYWQWSVEALNWAAEEWQIDVYDAFKEVFIEAREWLHRLFELALSPEEEPPRFSGSECLGALQERRLSAEWEKRLDFFVRQIQVLLLRDDDDDYGPAEIERVFGEEADGAATEEVARLWISLRAAVLGDKDWALFISTF